MSGSVAVKISPQPITVLQEWSSRVRGRVWKKSQNPAGKSYICILRNPCAVLILPDQSVDSPGTLAVRPGAAPLVLQVAWEAELPSRGEGLGLLDNPKSAWSSHAKAAASGKDTRVLNLQNKERRTWDSLFSPAWARRCTYLRAIASVNARILGLWSHAICHSGFIHCSHATRWGRTEQLHRRELIKRQNKLRKLDLIKQGELVTLSLTQRVPEWSLELLEREQGVTACWKIKTNFIQHATRCSLSLHPFNCYWSLIILFQWLKILESAYT